MSVHLGAGRWLPGPVAAGARLRLLCLPHAGAGASAYRRWGAGLPAWIGAVPVQPPGRETRLGERPYRDCRALVRDLAGEVAPTLSRPYAVFGHSLGALLAYELVRELIERGCPPPARLFVSGRKAPQLAETLPRLAGASLDELAGLLSLLGGTPPELLGDRKVLALMAPVLRADFAVNESHHYAPHAPLEVPITAFAATADARASVADVAAWGARTGAEFRLHTLHGGHFAVLEQATRVHALIAEELAPWS
ncbi:thioesterase II family protein [Sphaerisporangium rhizosphaerae]|uniref:Thioesterase II family protein n=1 Tax=Sphaerisporangium rhizosphaerae TaxID=2269375 RepID=A0ABW2PAB9_9ACTN